MHVRRHRAKGSDLDLTVFTIILFLGFIAAIIKVGLVLGAAVLVCMSPYLIYKKITGAAEERRKKQEEMEQKKAFLHSNPPVALKRSVSQKTDGYPETERIRQKFEEFVKEEDVLLGKEAYLNWLAKKSAIQRELGIAIESQQELNARMIETRTEIEVLEEILRGYELDWYKFSWMKKDGKYDTAFGILRSNLRASSNDESLNRFLKNVPKMFYSEFRDFEYIFTPQFVLKYYRIPMQFKVIKYSDISVSSYISTIRKEGAWNEYDEIAATHWEYERKDGGPDLRYKDNRSWTYVYKGSVHLEIDFDDIEFNFPNKTRAENYEKKVQDFLNLTQKKPYCDDIEKVLYRNLQETSIEDAKTYEESVKQISPDIIKPGLAVIHSVFGEGKINSISGKYMTVSFNICGNKKFKYPNAIQEGFFALDECKEKK